MGKMPQNGQHAPGNRDQGPAEEGLITSGSSAGAIFRRTLIQSFTVLAIVAAALTARATAPILLLFFAGILMAIILDMCGRCLRRVLPMPQALAISIVLLVLAGLLTLLIALTAPAIAAETAALATQLEASMAGLLGWVETHTGGRMLVDQLERLQASLSEGSALWQRAAGIFSTTLGALTGLLVVMIIGIFIAYRPGLYAGSFIKLIPVSQRDRAAEVLESMGSTLRAWILGQLVSMAVLAASTWVMLTLLGIPLALILALITGVMTFVPYIGPFFALVPILLLAFMKSPATALYALLLFMTVQNLEGNVLMPIVFQKTVHIPPALGVISQILFGAILGVPGIILATPLMAVAIQFVKMVYVEDVLGDRPDAEPSAADS